MQQEEAGEPELADHAQLLLQAAGGFVVLALLRIALDEPRPAELGQLAVGLGVLGAGIAVAEIAREVELAALGDPLRLEHRIGMVPEALRHLGGRRHHEARVAAPLGLGLVERRAQAHRDEGVLKARAAGVVCVHVAGRDARHAEPRGELGEHAVAHAVVPRRKAAGARSGNDPAERVQQTPAHPLGARQIAALDARGERAVARAAGEADESL